MKKILPAIFLLLLVLASCRNEKAARRLIDQAEQAATTHPDSAYLLLDSVPLPDELSSSLLARWCMLSGQTADKLFKDMPYVSQLLRARKWYQQYGTLEQQAWIGLYLGRSYVEDKLYLQATDAYSEALSCAKKGNAYNAAGYICSYMADLYEYNGMVAEERRKSEEAAGYFKKVENKRSYAFALRDIAKTWAFEDSCLLALEYMLMSDSIISEMNDFSGSAEIAVGLGNVYCMMGETDKARIYYLKSLMLDTVNIAPTCLALSYMYFNIGCLDSARFYVQRANVKTSNQYTPVAILHMQYEIEKASNNLEKAISYFECYDSAKDSLFDAAKDVDILDAEKRHNNLLLMDENSDLRISRLVFAFLMLVCVVICLLGWILYQEKIRRGILEINELQQSLDQKGSQLRQLTALQKKKEESNNSLEKDLNKQKEEIENTQKKINLLQKDINLLQKEKFNSSATVKRIKKLASKVIAGNSKSLLGMKEWNAIVEVLDTTYIGLPSFAQSKKWDLTQAELESCYLSFFDLGVHGEAILLHIDPESASKRRLRLRQKLGLEHKAINVSDHLISCMQSTI